MTDPEQTDAQWPEPDDPSSVGAGSDDLGRDAPSGKTEAHDPSGLGLAKTVAHAATGPRKNRSDATRYRPGQPPGRGPSHFGGAHPDDRDPQSLSRAMDRLIEDHGWSTEVSLRKLLGQWVSLVGGVNAAHSTPVGYRDGILVVQAESTVWATSLRTMAPQLVAKLNAALGDGAVTRVDVRGPQAPSWKKGRRSVRDGRGPRDTYG